MYYLLHGLSLPRTLLGLSDINIEHISLNQHHEILIQVKSTQAETTCRYCGHPTKPYGQGKTLKLRHLPILEQAIPWSSLVVSRKLCLMILEKVMSNIYC